MFPYSIVSERFTQAHNQVKCHADTGQIFKTGVAVSLLGINYGNSLRDDGVRFMVVGDDDVNVFSDCRLDRFMGTDAAVHSDDQVHIHGYGHFNVGQLKAVPFLCPVGHIPGQIRFHQGEKLVKHGRSRDAVGIKITKNKNFFFVAYRRMNPRYCLVHIL